jgi:hypothetical protein
MLAIPVGELQGVCRSLADMRELVKLGRLGSRVVLNMMRDIWGLIRQQG